MYLILGFLAVILWVQSVRVDVRNVTLPQICPQQLQIPNNLWWALTTEVFI